MKFDMDKMIEQLVDHEGLELPYEDSLGILTIGVEGTWKKEVYLKMKLSIFLVTI